MSIPFLKNDSLAPGAVEQTAPGVRRVLCGNPGPFTFRGTNSWIIGQGNSVAILDPGPVDAAHLDALLAATKGERITHMTCDCDGLNGRTSMTRAAKQTYLTIYNSLSWEEVERAKERL